MGQSLDIYMAGIDRYKNPDTVPDHKTDPQFDPQLGFSKPRTEKGKVI